MYGKIKESRLLNIEVYEGENLLYKGKVEDAPDEVKERNYETVKIKDGWVIYNVQNNENSKTKRKQGLNIMFKPCLGLLRICFFEPKANKIVCMALKTVGNQIIADK